MNPGTPNQTGGNDPDRRSEPRHSLAISLELAKNAMRAQTADELYFVLVNDTLTLLPFDRAWLVSHLGGESEVVAVNNQPKLERKAEWSPHAESLAGALRSVDSAALVFRESWKGLPEDVAERIRAYMEMSGCSGMLIAPLVHGNTIAGHVVFEFFGAMGPGQSETYAFLNMTPFLAYAFVRKWVEAHDRRVLEAFADLGKDLGVKGVFAGRRRLIIAVAIAALFLLTLIPITVQVGGRGEAVPENEYCAFVEMDGIIDKIHVKEGDSVRKDMTIAELDSQEIDYKTGQARRFVESYRLEMETLKAMGIQDPNKLAESKIVELKLLRAQQDVDFLDYQKQYLKVKAPLDGVVLSKKLETLRGRKFKAGEIFCKIAPNTPLILEVLVSESDIGYVHVNAEGEFYLNHKPEIGRKIKVTEIAPQAEIMERFGAVFRVKAAFLDPAPDMKFGMLGLAHISADTAPLLYAATRKFRARIGEWLLYW